VAKYDPILLLKGSEVGEHLQGEKNYSTSKDGAKEMVISGAKS